MHKRVLTEGDRLMPKAVRISDYGGIDVLEVREVARPEPGPGQVLVAVRAAGINPSDAAMRARRGPHRG
jgi:NADPH:quinone reductase-like Zn-dependent oxidoreductase